MPFTPSHAVVALPFIRTPLVPAAIAIGAMTPDLPLFVRGTPLTYATTHSWPGLFVTVVVAFALLLIWRCVLRPAVRELSPRWLAERLPAQWDMPAGEAARDAIGTDPRHPRGRAYPVLLVVSLLLGVVTHIVWDAFTHEARWGVRLVPPLSEPWGPFAGFKWLQYGSSLVGLAIIAVWAIVRLNRRTEPSAVSRVLPAAVRIAWWVSLPLVLIAGWVIGFAVYGPFDAGFGPEHLMHRALPPACGAWGMATVVLAVVVQVVRSRRRPRVAQDA